MAACALPKAYAEARELPRQILGVHLNMTKDEAHKRLQEIGTFERDERKQQEIWKVRDESFSHLIIGADKQGKLRFVTAVAKDSPKMRVGARGRDPKFLSTLSLKSLDGDSSAKEKK